MKQSTYSIINIVIICFMVYLFTLPVLSPVMEKILPDLWQCQYLRITGQECPFCGLTRDFRNIMYLSGVAPHNRFAYVIFAFCAGELFLRGLVSVVIFRKTPIGKIFKIDIIYNFIFVILLIVSIVVKLYN